MQAPMRSVSWRTVSSLVCTARSSSIISAALSKGMKQARWARCSCCRGARPPGSNASSSSRGKKTFPACGTGPIGSGQHHTLPPISLYGPFVFPSRLQRNSTGRTQRGWLPRRFPPLSARAFLCRILEDLRFQFHHALMDFVFDLHIGRFGMRSPPLFDVCQDLDTLVSPRLFVHLWSFFFRRLPDGSILPPLFTRTIPFAKILGAPYKKREAFWHTHSICQELVSCKVPPFQGSLANCCS